jgi:hypothetical protein
MKINFKNLLPHLAAIVLFVIASMAYFWPTFEGNQLKQGDVKQFRGMSKELEDYRMMNKEEALWTNAMFGGMPAYQISIQHKGNLMVYVNKYMQLGLPLPVGLMFIAMLGFYIFALCMRINPWLGMVGGLAFGFSTINVLYLGAGHVTKVNAIAYMAPTLGGLILAFRGKWLLGSAVFGFFFALNLTANHLQMTYYLAFLLGAVALAEAIRMGIKKEFMDLLKVAGGLVVAAALALLPSWGNLSTTLEYSKYTTRGATDLTLKPKGDKETRSAEGLNKNYILEYNYGKGEWLSLIAPNAKGAKDDLIGNDEDVMGNVDPQYSQQIGQMNRYWGGQRMSGGAFYFGVVMAVLFLFGLVFLKDTLKWPFLVLALLAIVLSSNDPGGLNDFFINKIPLYNKFRDSKMILVLLQVMLPAFGILFIDRMLEKKDVWGDKKAWLIGSGVVVLIGFVLYISPSISGSFIKMEEIKQFDQAMSQSKDPESVTMLNGLKQELINTRTAIYKSEMGRTLFLMLVACGLVLSMAYWKLNRTLITIALLLVVMGDNLMVARRYLNSEGDGSTYVSYEPVESSMVPFIAQNADMSILASEKGSVSGFEDKVSSFKNEMSEYSVYAGIENTMTVNDYAAFGVLNLNTNFRVLNFNNPFNETATSFFHKSLGGYHGAKLKRYQEMIDFHIGEEMGKFNAVISAAKNAKLREYATKTPIAPEQAQGVFDTIQVTEVQVPDTVPVLNMLNTRYVILDPSKPAIKNTNANGPAWFVENVQQVSSTNDEMKALFKMNSKTTAVVHSSFNGVKKPAGKDSTATIKMVAYKTKALTYSSSNKYEAPAIFSEIYYPEGWNCYIDGKKVEPFRANYILRGVMVPAGKHQIEWKFEPAKYEVASSMTFVGSLLLLLGFVYALWHAWRNGEQKPEVDTENNK